MAIWEVVILILVAGVVLMMVSLALMAGISRMIDAKTESRIKLTTTLWKQEMEYVDRVFDKYMTRIEKMIDKIVNKETPKD